MLNSSTTIDINENRHRYFFTREATQKDMEQRFGVTVETVGKYYPNRSLATPSCPPLAIKIRGTEGAVEKAIQFVNQVLQNGPPPNIPSSNTNTLISQHLQRKIYLGFIPEASRISEVRANILGPPPGASHLLYISRTAGPGTSCFLRGQGSGHVVLGATPEQLADPMHILITAGNEQEMECACTLAEDLVMVVRHAHDHRIKLF